MNPTDADFASIGFTEADWKALLFGTGSIPFAKLSTARAAVARIGRYSETQANDHEVTDYALRLIALNFPHRCFPSPFTEAERLRFFQLREGLTAEDAQRRLDEIAKERAEEDRLFGGAAQRGSD